MITNALQCEECWNIYFLIYIAKNRHPELYISFLLFRHQTKFYCYRYIFYRYVFFDKTVKNQSNGQKRAFKFFCVYIEKVMKNISHYSNKYSIKMIGKHFSIFVYLFSIRYERIPPDTKINIQRWLILIFFSHFNKIFHSYFQTNRIIIRLQNHTK